MILVTVHTVGKFCEISLSNNIQTINLTKEINPLSKPNFSIFSSILKGVILLVTKSLMKGLFLVFYSAKHFLLLSEN